MPSWNYSKFQQISYLNPPKSPKSSFPIAAQRNVQRQGVFHSWIFHSLELWVYTSVSSEWRAIEGWYGHECYGPWMVMDPFWGYLWVTLVLSRRISWEISMSQNRGHPMIMFWRTALIHHRLAAAIGHRVSGDARGSQAKLIPSNLCNVPGRWNGELWVCG